MKNRAAHLVKARKKLLLKFGTAAAGALVLISTVAVWANVSAALCMPTGTQTNLYNPPLSSPALSGSESALSRAQAVGVPLPNAPLSGAASPSSAGQTAVSSLCVSANAVAPIKAAAIQPAALAASSLIGTHKTFFSGDPYRYPQCVWYAWARVKEATGISLAFQGGGYPSARYWLNSVVQSDDVTVVRNRSAVRACALAVFSHGGKGNGHVVFIESVQRNSSGEPVSVKFSESNWTASKSPDMQSMSWGAFLSRSNGSLMGYIYV